MAAGTSGPPMKSLALVWQCAALALPAFSQDPGRNPDLDGWWSAEPAWGGETSRLVLQFLDQDGKQQGRLWLMAIGAYDIPLGEVKLSGNAVDFKESFPLTWNPATQTLGGTIPADAAPVYHIPVEFRRSAPPEKPALRDWKSAAPAPKVVWSAETGSA